MSAPTTLLQAAMQRLAARMGSAVVDTAASLAVLAQDAPSRLQQEISLFWQEVEMEAERIERAGGSGPDATGSADTPASASTSAPGTTTVPGATADPTLDPQEQIDRLRAQVAALARRLESPTP